MTSSVFYKLGKSQKDASRVEFDGTGLSVWELKRDIIKQSGLGDGTDFDLFVYAEDGEGECIELFATSLTANCVTEYSDDTTIIPRSTTVIARRQPAMKPGSGRAARYVTGKMPTNSKNSSRREHTSKPVKPSTAGLAQMSTALTEEEKLAAMFQVQSDQWQAQQEEMAHQAPVYKPGQKKPVGNVPDHEPPNGYICYRCGKKGHFIQVCPTNDDPEFDNRPRVKRTTGIPRSFLKTVDKSVLQQKEGEDGVKTAGLMVNADGDYVIAEPDAASWEQFQAKTKTSAAAQKAASDEDKELEERGLLCAVDKRLFIDPMKTPCCEKTYCNDCITNALIESDFVCPACQMDGVLIDDLKPDEDASGKIQEYLKEKEAAKTKERSKSPAEEPSTQAPSPPSDIKVDGEASSSKSETTAPGTTAEMAGKKESPTSTPSTTTTPTTTQTTAPAAGTPQASATPTAPASGTGQKPDPSAPKKRPADELLENPKIPKAPKAMQKAQEAKEMQQNMMMNGMGGMMPNMMMNPMMGMNGFNGFPNMGMGMGMPMMPSMNMNMMNPMMGMNGFNQGGFPNMNGFAFGNMNGGGGNMGMGHMNGGGFQQQQQQQPNRPNFTQPSTDDDAYFRKPVNPGRHQNRQRRNRPSDYREL